MRLAALELRLYLREPSAFFFTLIFPLLLMLLFGSIWGNDPFPEQTFGYIDYSTSAFIGIVILTAGIMNLTVSIASYREKGILRRFMAAPISPLIFLAAAMRQGPSPRAMHELSALFGADRRTIARWQVLWQEHFPRTRFWKVERARLPRPNEAMLFPRALLVAFFTSHNPRDDWERLLRFLSPITIAGGLALAIRR